MHASPLLELFDYTLGEFKPTMPTLSLKSKAKKKGGNPKRDRKLDAERRRLRLEAEARPQTGDLDQSPGFRAPPIVSTGDEEAQLQIPAAKAPNGAHGTKTTTSKDCPSSFSQRRTSFDTSSAK